MKNGKAEKMGKLAKTKEIKNVENKIYDELLKLSNK